MDVTREVFAELFRPFRSASPEVVDRILEASAVKTIPKDTTLYREGDSCGGIGFVLSGQIRVYRIGESGREITLYEIDPGETCILNASCLLSRADYPALAETTTDVELLMVPGDLFRRLVEEEPVMRSFVLSLFSDRLGAIMELVEEVAFGRMDRRLSDFIVEKAEDGILPMTHQAIANELGTSREVVSRLLKDLERKGKVRLSRNEIRTIGL